MSALDIVKRIESDGVRLALSDSGTLKAVGDGAAVNRWLSIIRERKSEIIAALQQAENDPADKPISILSSQGETVIIAWLAAIGETDPVTIGEGNVFGTWRSTRSILRHPTPSPGSSA